MKSIYALICSLLFIGAVHAQVINDPNAQVRNVSAFNAIDVSGGIDLYITQGSKESIAVSGKTTEYRDEIKTIVENGTLKIFVVNSDKFMRKFGNRDLKAYISVRDLKKLTASGASDIRVSGALKVGDMEMKLSGASDFNGDIHAESMNISISGASDITIEGKVKDLSVKASGASDFKGYDLLAEQCTAQASGASDIKISVSGELQPKASGASSIYYRGKGVIRNIQTSGASSVSRRD